MIRTTTILALAALSMSVVTTLAGQATDESQAEPQAPAKTVAGAAPSAWSEPIGGLQFRLSAPRTLFQAWELPSLVLEVRNAGGEPVTDKTVAAVFDTKTGHRLRFLFKEGHRRGPNPNRPLAPEVRFDPAKLVGLKPGETTSQIVVVDALAEEDRRVPERYPLSAGRYTIGLGVLTANSEANTLKTGAVALEVLPQGVKSREELMAYLKPYTVGGASILAGFVPDKTALVRGEPIAATFVVENLGDKPFAFETGGHNRGPRNFRYEVEIYNASGRLLDDPSDGRDLGGRNRTLIVGAHDAASETLDLRAYRDVGRVGSFRVTCRFALEPPEIGEKDFGDFNVPVETSYQLLIEPRDPDHVEHLLDQWFDEANGTGSLALDERVQRIASLGGEAAVGLLAEMGKRGDVEHRVAAARGLGKIDSEDAAKALMEIERDEAAEVRAAAIDSLGAQKYLAAVPSLIQSLSDENEAIRKSAANALAITGTEPAINALIEQLPQADPETTATILRVLGRSKRGRRSPRVFDVVVRSLADKNDAVRLAALEAVAHLPAADAAAALRPLAASDDANTDFREAVIRTLAEKLSQPIEIGWLAAIIKSRNVSKPPYVPTPEEERNDPEAALRKVMESVTPVSLGDAPRLMRLYGGTEAVPALLGCLDFENPAVRSYYNAAIITEQLACSGPLAIPWHGDLNRDGTQQETEENRHTLAKLKVWVDYCQTHPGTGAVAPPNPNPAKDQESWGTEVEGLSIRARLNRSVWPAGLPQVATIDACTLPDGKRTSWGTVALSSRAAALEVEINGEWYTLPGDADQSVCGEWNAYHGNRWQDLQLDGRWRRRSDGQALDLKPGKYTVRVALSRLPTGERTGLATSEPTSFEVIATE